jgi:hypothetical protein
MKIKTDPTIQYMSGRFPGSTLVMVNPKGKLLTNARAHVIPDNIAQQEAFAANIASVSQTWRDAKPEFKTDMETYKDAYNLTVVDNEHMNVSAYSLFIKGCFAASEKSGVALTTLDISVDNATFKVLLGGSARADVNTLVRYAVLPHAGLSDAELSALNAEIAPEA